MLSNPRVMLLIILALVMGALVWVVKHPATLGLDLSGGVRLLMEAKAPTQQGKSTAVVAPKAMDALQQIIQRRIDQMGVAETVVQRSGENRLIVEIPGVFDPEEAKARIGKTGLLEFRTVSKDPKTGDLVWLPSGVSGRDLESADVAPDGANGWVVSFQLNEQGKTAFRKLTEKLVVNHEPLGIFFDGVQISAPSVQSAIPTGSGQITGSFKYDEAKSMVDTLNAGALPLDVSFIEENTVGPLLGAASIRQSMTAGLAGLGLVLLFMVGVYRLQGLVASAALLVYTLLCYALFNLVGVTFTLAGIAGFILSVGMAVDANILIFARMKEELAMGRSMLKAIDVGFDRAFPSILDSNGTTLITCTLLYLLGTGSVKGFALTLAIGVAVSMFSAITVTKTFLHLMFDNQRDSQRSAAAH